MNRLAIVMVLAMVTVFASLSQVHGEAYNTIIVDENLEVSLSYPPEVKFGSCYTFRFKAKAFDTLTIDKIKLTIKMFTNGLAETLYDKVLISSETVTSSWTFSKNIQICIPSRPKPDPYLEGKIYVEYSTDDDDPTLSAEWYMSTVREMTYDELASELEEAEREIEDLEELIRDLQLLIEDLEDEIESLSKNYNKLSSSYESLSNNYLKVQEDYREIQEKYNKLEEDYKKLNEEYDKLLIDYEKLRTSYENLIKNNEQLQSNYDSLRDDYRSLSDEYNRLRGMHQDLTDRYNELKSRYESSINTIGRLESTISNLEESVREKQQKIDELNLIYASTANENTLTKNILYAQTAAVAGIGMSIFVMSLRRKKMPPPPSTVEPTATPTRGEGTENSKNGKIQKVLSGRRITLPRDAVEKLNIKEGGKVIVEVYEDYVKVIPVKEEISESTDKV